MIVIINAATSVDGKICTSTGESKISSYEDLKRVHKLRSQVDGILVGISTVLKDDPVLNVRFTKQVNNKKREETPERVRLLYSYRICI